jgi:hypothetical protein
MEVARSKRELCCNAGGDDERVRARGGIVTSRIGCVILRTMRNVGGQEVD